MTASDNFSSTSGMRYNHRLCILCLIMTFIINTNNISAQDSSVVSNTLKESIVLSNKGLRADAINKAKEAIIKDSLGVGGLHPYLVMDYYYLAYLCNKDKDYAESINFGNKALELHDNVYRKENKSGREQILNVLFYDYLLTKQYTDAINIGLQETELLKDDNLDKYATVLNNVAFCYNKIRDYQNAFLLSMQCLNIRKSLYGIYSRIYAQTLQNLYTYSYNLGEYRRAISLAKEELISDSVVYGANSQRIGQVLHNIASCYLSLNEYENTEQYALKALNLKKSHYPKNRQSILNTLRVLESNANHNAYWTKAINYAQQSLDLQNPDFSIDIRTNTTLLNNMANYYSYLGQYEKSIELGESVVDIEIQIGLSPNLVMSLNNLSLYYSYTKKYAESLKTLEKAKEIGIDIWGENSKEMSTIYGNLALNYCEAGNYTKAINYCKKSLSVNLDTSSLATHLIQYSNILLCVDSVDEAINNLNRSIRLLERMRDNTPLYYEANFLLGQCYFHKKQYEQGEMCFNRTLRVISWFNEQLKDLSVKEREDFEDKWGYLLNETQQYLLIDSSKAMRSIAYNASLAYKSLLLYPNEKIYTLENVLKHINSNDAAIEFVRIIDDNNHETYCALILKKGSDHPYFVIIANDSVIKEAADENKGFDKLYDIIWKPLENYLDGITNIYFSPVGILNTCPIEHFLKEKNVMRLSSTKWVAKNISERRGDFRYALIGGINYNRQAYQGDVSPNKSLNNISLGTRLEIDSISQLIKHHKYYYKVFSGNVGKSVFDSIADYRFTNLHIATHGYYWEDSILFKRRANKLSLPIPFDKSFESFILTRCGLLLTGAQESLSGCNPQLDVNDNGIMSGYEISKFNFSNIELVVLSACETAAGSNTFDEGCYGLQRAFKRAGAKSILMSLWKTDDSVSRMLMEEFYLYYLSGLNKSESLERAINYIRYYKDKDGNFLFSDPTYWAGFIMMD